MNATTSVNWSLEVVRGKAAGRAYPLRAGEVVLGNAPGNGTAIDLADQEGNAPKRMAARQAAIECSKSGVLVRDLDSPGGTFVNRQRLLAGQARPLLEGDVIQLGGVQLKLVAGANGVPRHQPPIARPPAFSKPFTLQSGAVCRSCDDLLVISAQRWVELRDELTSGRLAAHLASIGRTDLAPSADAPGSPDERLDAWIASLPTSKPSVPELDVHPSTLVVRAIPGGGTTRTKLRLINAGYRLLRARAKVEPPSASWLKVVDGREIVASEGADLAVDLTIPDRLDSPLTATLVIDGNGGTRRVPVRLESAAATDAIPDAPEFVPRSIQFNLREHLTPFPLRRRLIVAVVAAAGLRLVVGLIGSMLGLSAPLAPAALLGVVTGAILGARFALHRQSPRDLPTASFAGGFAGVLLASGYIAACRSVESLLGSWGGSLVVVTILWAAIGAALAVLSGWIAPAREVQR